VAGALGLDREFFESILVPQVMLYGFLGFKPTVGGCEIPPRLPSDWPSLTIARIHLHDHVLDVSVASRTIEVIDHTPDRGSVDVSVPAGWSLKRTSTALAGQLARGPAGSRMSKRPM